MDMAHSQTRHGGGSLPTTRWTLIHAVSADNPTERRQALEVLARAYWQPVYTYIRTWRHSPEEAEDLTQSFLADFIERDSFAGLDAEGGRFRSWILAALKNFLIDDHRARTRIKRGGGVVHLSIDRDLGEEWLGAPQAAGAAPDVIFDRRWVAGILEGSLTQLREQCVKEGKQRNFEVLVPLIAGMDHRASYADAALALGISEGNARVVAFRLRKRLRALVREAVEATVSSAEDVAEELDHLFAVFAESGP